MARLVSGPTASSVSSPGRSRPSRRICSGADTPATCPRGSGSPLLPRPSSPCIPNAYPTGWAIGRAAPTATGTPSRPAHSSTRSAFRAPTSGATFPCTVPTAASSAAPVAASRARYSRATVSSIPGSQSSKMAVVTDLL